MHIYFGRCYLQLAFRLFLEKARKDKLLSIADSERATTPIYIYKLQ